MSSWLIHSRRWGGHLWFALAILLVLLALLIGGFRAFVPYLDHYRDDILGWVEQEYAIHLNAGEITAYWHQFGLNLDIKQVELEQSEQAVLRFIHGDVSLRLDLIESLKTRALQFDEVKLARAKVIFTPQNLSPSSQPNGQVRDVVRRLLFQRFDAFELTKSQLLIVSDGESLPPIQIERLSWLNNGLHHQGIGEAQFNAFPGQYTDFIVNFSEDETDPNIFTGQLFVEVGNVEFHPYLTPFVSDDIELTTSLLNFQSWVDFSQQGIEQINLQLGENNLAWQGQRKHSLTLNQGQLIARPVGSGWQVISDQLAIVLDEHQSYPLAMSYRSEPPRRQLQLQSLPAVLLPPLTELLHGSLPLPIDSTGVTGRIESLVFDHHQDKGWQLWFDMAELGWQAKAWLPGVPQIDAHVYTRSEGGYAHIQMGEQVIGSGALFYEPLLMDKLDTRLQWRKSSSGWLVQADELALSVMDLELAASGQVAFPDGEDSSPQLSLYGELALSDATSAKYYLPLNYIQNTADYLARAIKAGVSDDGQFLWHGELGEFPYAAKQGIFQARLPLREARFHFWDGWPALNHMDLNLLFENDGLWMDSTKVLIDDVVVEQIHAAIPRLGKGAVLSIDATIAENDLIPVRAFVEHSPLQNSVGATLSSFDFTGNVAADLALSIPLQAGRTPDVSGTVRLLEVDGHLPALPDHSLEHISGEVHFDGVRVHANEITAMLQMQPVQVNFVTDKQPEHYQADVNVTGEWPVTALHHYLPNWLAERVSGNMAWQSQVTAKIDARGVRTDILFDSDMQGVAADFPQPFHKLAKQRWPAHAAVTVAPTGNVQFDLTIADKLQLAEQFNRGNTTPSLIWVGLGHVQRPALRTGDAILDASVDEMIFADWWPVIRQITTAESEQGGLAIRNMRVDAQELDVWSVPFSDVSLSATSSPFSWVAELRSRETESLLTFDKRNQQWNLQADYVDLPAFWVNEEETALPAEAPREEHDKAVVSAIDPSGLPAMDLLCLKCTVGPYHLGELRLNLVPTESGNGLMASEGWMRLPDGQFNLTQAHWLKQGQSSVTDVKGTISAHEASALLSSIDASLELPVKKSKLNAEIQGGWQGSPFDFSLRGVNASAFVKLGEGYIPNLSDQGTRVFSVLSVDSLLRKLRLDFSDLLDEGMFYSGMKGDFTLVNGVASSQIKMDGVAGDMEIDGSTDLLSRQLDYKVLFYPDITASLPMLGFITTANPVTGLAVFALSEVLSPVVDVITGIEFSVTGTAASPVITETKRTRKEYEVRPYPYLPDKQPTKKGTPSLEPATQPDKSGLPVGSQS